MNFIEQLIMQLAFVQQSGIATCELHFGTQVPAISKFYCAFKSSATFFRFAAQRRRSNRCQHAEVDVYGRFVLAVANLQVAPSAALRHAASRASRDESRQNARRM